MAHCVRLCLRTRVCVLAHYLSLIIPRVLSRSLCGGAYQAGHRFGGSGPSPGDAQLVRPLRYESWLLSRPHVRQKRVLSPVRLSFVHVCFMGGSSEMCASEVFVVDEGPKSRLGAETGLTNTEDGGNNTMFAYCVSLVRSVNSLCARCLRSSCVARMAFSGRGKRGSGGLGPKITPSTVYAVPSKYP